MPINIGHMFSGRSPWAAPYVMWPKIDLPQSGEELHERLKGQTRRQLLIPCTLCILFVVTSSNLRYLNLTTCLRMVGYQWQSRVTSNIHEASSLGQYDTVLCIRHKLSHLTVVDTSRHPYVVQSFSSWHDC